MTKKFFTFLVFPLFFIAVAFFAGCFSPIGGLQIDNSGKYIRAEPGKWQYLLDDTFNVTDVNAVIYGFEGREQRFNINDIIDDVEIYIIEEPADPDANVYPVTPGFGKHRLRKLGSPAVDVYYRGIKARYFIQVVKRGTVPGLPGETGIIIKWPDKQPDD